MTIRVLSLDFDGCLFNPTYCRSLSKNVIRANRHFLKSLKHDNHLYSESTVFIGSNRQSKATDDINLRNRGSCFPAMDEIKNYIEATFDCFLLADLYGNLPDGTSFYRATNKHYKGTHAHWVFDESKVTLLYAQMHRMAQEQPHESIIFDFFDDRDQDILDWLTTFYSAHPELIPHNLTLRLNHYMGQECTLISQIQGTGFIDSNYRQTVKDMAAQAQAAQTSTSSTDEINAALKVQPHLLGNRIQFVPVSDAPAAATPTINQQSQAASIDEAMPASREAPNKEDSLALFAEVCSSSPKARPISATDVAHTSPNQSQKRKRLANKQEELKEDKHHAEQKSNVNTRMKSSLAASPMGFFSEQLNASKSLSIEDKTQYSAGC